MKLNKETQYSILFALYLARAGRATVEVAADNLGIPSNFLQQIARRLKDKHVLKSVRGPGGGYELVDDIRLIDVINSISGNGLLSTAERQKYATGGLEERAFEHFISNLGLAMWPILNRKVVNVMKELIANETAQLNKLTKEALEQ